jgi:hypothetical protein
MTQEDRDFFELERKELTRLSVIKNLFIMYESFM